MYHGKPIQTVGRKGADGAFRHRLKALVLSVSVTFVLMILASTGISRAAEADVLAEARTLIAAEQFTAASDLLRKVTSKDDAPLDAWLLLGVAYEAQGLNSRAVSAYEQAMSMDKDNLEGGLGLGRNLVQIASKRPESVRLYKRLLKVYPDEPRLHYALGMAYNALAEVGYAFEEYKVLKDQDPDLARQLYDAIFMR